MRSRAAIWRMGNLCHPCARWRQRRSSTTTRRPGPTGSSRFWGSCGRKTARASSSRARASASLASGAATKRWRF
ncbi:UNVERIFIED_CONTAM: hypothetical protein GTU68_050329 [Idotea baltica]|nr:hypothetical protein [Idotea baltica]